MESELGAGSQAGGREELDEPLQEQLQTVTCPDHHLHPTILPQGEDWRIEACCEKAAQMAKEALAEVLE